MDTLDIINKDITMAKTYGIDLNSVGNRGSQYRVEALLARISRINKFLLLSASRKQVLNQNILEVKYKEYWIHFKEKSLSSTNNQHNYRKYKFKFNSQSIVFIIDLI